MTTSQPIIDLLNNNKEFIYYDYNDIKDLIVIDKKIYVQIQSNLKRLKKTETQLKDILKQSIREALKLQQKDIILIKKEQIVIKIIKNIEKVENEKRCNGYSVDKIDSLYYEYFDDENSLKTFIASLSDDIFKYLFVRKQVNNDFYEKNVYAIIQRHILNELSDIDNANIEIKKGFSAYILRVNFLEIFSIISDNILEEISRRDGYLMNWLKYYNGQVLVEKNKRFEAPSIMNNEGQKYNPSAIFGTISMWYKTKEKITALKKRLHDVDNNLERLKINNLTPTQYKEELLKERRELEQYVSESNEKIKNLMDKKLLNKDEDLKYDINDEIQALRHDIKEDRVDIEEINSMISSLDTVNTKRLEEDKSRIEKDINREEKALKQNVKVYKSIHSALVKALTSKRKPI